MSHQHHDIFESRKQFQLERMILFSDAVFAIAITLLIIEIKIPHFEHQPTQHELIEGLLEKLPDFIGFIISFVVIGQFWSNHHKLFGYITDFTPGLSWLNLLLLFWVVLMPFSSYLNMQYGNLDVTWVWYCLNLTAIGFSLYLIWRYIAKHKQLTFMGHDQTFMAYHKKRARMVTLVFLSGAILTLFPVLWMKWVSRFIFILLFPLFSIMRKQYEKQKKIKASHS